MTISYSNLKSEAQKAQDNAQGAMVSQWCQDRRDAGEVIDASDVTGDTAGLLVLCTTMRARGLAKEEMTTRETRQMHPVTRGEDFEGYDSRNRRQSQRYLEAHVGGSFAGIPQEGFGIVERPNSHQSA